MDSTPENTDKPESQPQGDTSTDQPPKGNPSKPEKDNSSSNTDKKDEHSNNGGDYANKLPIETDPISKPSTPLLSRPPSATNYPAQSTNDKDGPLTEPNSSTPVTPSITPIKGKTTPKPHVIKVNEKKEPEKDVNSETKPASDNNMIKTASPISSQKHNNNNDNNNINNNNDNISDDKNKPELTKQDTSVSQTKKPRALQRQRTYMQLMRDDSKTSAIANDICKMFSVFFALGVRSVLAGFCMLTIWLVVHRLHNDYYYLMCITFVFHIVETVNIVISRAGQERKWFCLCFLTYLITCVPCIWILEIDRLNDFQNAISNATLAVDVAGVTANVTLDPNTLLSVTEQCLIFLLILCRWLLPRGEISRDRLSQLLFVYIGMASDVMELFQLFDESDVREDRTLTYIILSVWSLSLLQFTMVLTMARNPKKCRTAVDHDDETARIKARKRLKDRSFILVLTQSELWSLCVSIFMQDGPFLAVRMYTLITHNLINYSIIFFTCKNILVIMLLLYRVFILLLEKWENHRKEKKERAEGGGDDESGKRNTPKTISTHLSLSDMEDEKRKPATHPSDVDINGSKETSDGLRARHNNQVSPA